MIGLTGARRSRWAVAVSRRRIWFAGINPAFKQANQSVSRSLKFLYCNNSTYGKFRDAEISAVCFLLSQCHAV